MQLPGCFITALAAIIVLSASCEGYRCAEGNIFDSDTREPLDSVLCRVLTGADEQFSDSTGLYEVCNPFGGCMPDCPDIEVEYSKNGYKTRKITNPGYGEVFLEKR